MILLYGSVALAVGFVATFGFCRYSVGVCRSRRDLKGKTVIVTGANTGIGLETARDFAARNAKVILACRSKSKGERAKKDIVLTTGNSNVVVKEVDLSSFDSVRAFAKDVLQSERRLHVLVNNAGILFPGKSKSVDGVELNMATNHFGPFLLTNLLLPLLKDSAPSRIVIVSSQAYKLAKLDLEDLTGEKLRSSHKLESYARSKLANIMFTRVLAERLKGAGVTANALHPGAVNTELERYAGGTWLQIIVLIFRPFMKTAKEGAQTSIYLAVSEEVEAVSGKYFGDCKEMKPKRHALDEFVATRLWECSERVTNLNQGIF